MPATSGSVRSRPDLKDVDLLVLAKGYTPTPGGVESYSEQIVEAYMRNGLRPVVVTQIEGERGWSRRSTDAGDYDLWNAGSGSQPVTFLRMIRATVGVRRRGKVQAVHATTWRVGLVAALVMRGALLILTVHGREVLNYPALLRRPMVHVLRSANLVLAISRATYDVARPIVGDQGIDGRWIISYNGLTWPDQARATARDLHDGPLRILSLSRLVPRKNIDGAVRAVTAAAPETPNGIDYRIAGTGSDRERIGQLIRDLDAGDTIEMLGYVPDEQVTDLYRWADVFLHPHTHVGEANDFEGFGLVIADAMSFGCAVIVGDIGGPRELVVPGESGVLVDGADHQALTAALASLANDSEMLRKLGSAARDESLNRFSWDGHIVPALKLIRGKTQHGVSAG